MMSSDSCPLDTSQTVANDSILGPQNRLTRLPSDRLDTMPTRSKP